MIFWIIAAAASLALAAYLVWPLARGGARPAAALVAVAAPAIAVAAYLAVGSPDLARLGGADDGVTEEIATTLAAMEARTEAAPDDPEAWRSLASAQLAAQQYEEAAASLETLIALEPDDVSLHSALGEALVMARGGVVSEEARAAFEVARAAEPGDIRAIFYLAEAEYQAGRREAAIAAWGQLAESAPPGAPWLVTVARRLSRAAAAQEQSLDALGLAPQTVDALDAALNGRAPPRRGPSQADVEAAQDMDPEAQAAMIESMVGGLAARLEQNPDDLEGWRMLARSYRNLGRSEESAQAFGEIARLQPDSVDAYRDYVYALWVAHVESGEEPDAATIAALEELHARDESDPVALLALAEVAETGGDPARARTLLERLLSDAAAPDILRQEAQTRLEALN